MLNFDEVLSRFKIHFKNLYILLFCACLSVFFAFYRNRFFEIPYNIKGLLFCASYFSVFFLLIRSKPVKLFFDMNREMFTFKQIKKTQNESKPNKLVNILFFIIPFFIYGVIYLFINMLNFSMLILISVLFLLIIVLAYLFYLIKHYLFVKNHKDINIFYGILPDIFLAILFLFILPSLIYPVIAVKRYRYNCTSYLFIDKTSDNKAGLQRSEKDVINRILKKYNCRECGKNYGITATVMQCPDGCVKMKITSEYVSSNNPSKSFEHTLSLIIDDFNASKYFTINKKEQPGVVISKNRVKQSRIPGGIPSMFTYLILLSVLSFKNLHSNILMKYKNYLCEIEAVKQNNQGNQEHTD